MKTADVISRATRHLAGLQGHEFDVLEVAKPVSAAAAVNLAKVVSKLSPIVGNLIEFNACEYLNAVEEFAGLGKWYRQDPGFPDTVFLGGITPTPGLEIKAWFPLATEITARFKDSQNFFVDDNTYVALLAWLPEFLIFGKPHIVNVCVVSGASVAKARDDHYHNPPDYLVIEPNDTTARTVNLQQTNTAGYKFQGTPQEFAAAKAIVEGWGEGAEAYNPGTEYQTKLATLMSEFRYRLDTNFAKLDRIVHPGIERFKRLIYQTDYHGRAIGDWNRLLASGDEIAVASALTAAFKIGEVDGEELVE